MRIIIFILLLTFSLSSKAQTTNPFDALKYDKVVFFDFEPTFKEEPRILDNNGKALQVIVKRVQLPSAIITDLNSRLSSKKSYGAGTAPCFVPHCGFVYYLKGKPLAQVTVCLECNRLYSTVDIPAQKQGKTVKGTYYELDGLSKSFQQYINGMLIKYGFSHHL
jgi:hypothetical protein